MALKIMGLVVYNVAWVEAYFRTKWRLDPSSRLATTDMGRKFVGGCDPFGELGAHLTRCGQGRGLLPYQIASWSIQTFCHNRHGPKSGGLLCPFSARRAESPSYTMSPGPRRTSIPSGIFIHPSSRLATTDVGRKLGGCAPSGDGLGSHLTQCGWAEAYLHAKFHPDPSNRLATIQEQRWQTSRTDKRQRSDSIGRTIFGDRL